MLLKMIMAQPVVHEDAAYYALKIEKNSLECENEFENTEILPSLSAIPIVPP